jgi:hypothetical protein
MKGVSNVQTHPLDFEEILVSDFAHSSWAIGKDETLGSQSFRFDKKALGTLSQ